MLAVDGVHERLHDPQRPGRRLAATGMHEAGEQRFAFHAASLPREYRGACGRLGKQGAMTEPIEHLPPEDEADLAALADGSLYGPRRAALEARLAAEPELAAALARQRAVVARLIATAPPAPLGLRMLRRGARGRAAGVARRRWRRGRPPRSRWPPRVALFVVLLAAPGRRSTTCWPSPRGRRRRRPRWTASSRACGSRVREVAGDRRAHGRGRRP